MPIVQVLDGQLINGVVQSRSVSFNNVESHTFTGHVDFSGNGFDPTVDANFSYILRMIRELDPHSPQIVATYEFPLGSTQSVNWTGTVRRVRLTLETSKIVTAALTLSY